MKYFLGLFLSLAVVLTFLAPFALSAGFNDAQNQLEEAGSAAYGEEATESSVEEVAGSIINALLSMSGVIFMLLMVYGGYLWMTGRDDTKQVEDAKKVIRAAIVGILIVVASYGISRFIIESLFTDSGTTEKGEVLNAYPD